MRSLAFLAVLLAGYVVLLIPFTRLQQEKPFLEKVGYVPPATIIKIFACDQRQTVAAGLMFKVLIYYGTLVEKKRVGPTNTPDAPSIHAILAAISHLDPYSMDLYYFAQSLVWDETRVRETTALLESGMRYRDWDFYLPFFAGFNYAFFLKDYAAAAAHYATAARLTGSDLFSKLASRYMHEAGQTEVAIAYLDTMLKSVRNEGIKQSYTLRRDAFLQVRQIEKARDGFRERFGRQPATIQELYELGLLSNQVIDPYGGVFYLESDGTVQTTSKFAPKPDKN